MVLPLRVVGFIFRRKKKGVVLLCKSECCVKEWDGM